MAANAIGNLEVDPERSILLALQAVDATKKQDGIVLREAEEALHRAVQTSRVVHTITGITNPNQVAYSADGKLLAVRGKGVIEIFDAQAANERVAISITPGVTDHIAFSTDGKQLVTFDILPEGENIILKIFDVQTGNTIKSLPLPVLIKDWSYSAYSPDWKRVAVGLTDGTTHIFDMATGKELMVLKGHTDYVEDVAYSPDITKIATASDDKTAKIWDALTGKELLTLRGHEDPVSQVEFSADGTRLATGSQDGTARIWDTNTGNELLKINTSDWITSVHFSHDGKRILTTSLGRGGRIWDAETGQELATVVGHTGVVSSSVWSPDGTVVATASRDGSVRVWSLARGQEVFSAPTGRFATSGAGKLEYSPDGVHVAVGLNDGRIKIWNVDTGQEMAFQAHDAAVNHARFSSDGARLASPGDDHTVKIWDVATGKLLFVFRGHSDNVTSVVFTSDGKNIASGSEDKTVKIWDPNTGQVLKTIDTTAITTADHIPVYGLAYSPNDSQLATSFGDGMLANWDLRTDKPLFSIQAGTQGGVFSVAFSPDGSRLAYTTAGVAKVLDAQTGKEILSLGNASNPSASIRYSSDGKFLVTASDYGAVVWDAATGQELLAFTGSPSPVVGVAFSPDGTRLALANDVYMHIYLLHIEDLLALAKTRVTRALTQEECQKYLHVEECP